MVDSADRPALTPSKHRADPSLAAPPSKSETEKETERELLLAKMQIVALKGQLESVSGQLESVSGQLESVPGQLESVPGRVGVRDSKPRTGSSQREAAGDSVSSGRAGVNDQHGSVSSGRVTSRIGGKPLAHGGLYDNDIRHRMSAMTSERSERSERTDDDASLEDSYVGGGATGRMGRGSNKDTDNRHRDSDIGSADSRHTDSRHTNSRHTDNRHTDSRHSYRDAHTQLEGLEEGEELESESDRGSRRGAEVVSWWGNMDSEKEGDVRAETPSSVRTPNPSLFRGQNPSSAVSAAPSSDVYGNVTYGASQSEGERGGGGSNGGRSDEGGRVGMRNSTGGVEDVEGQSDSGVESRRHSVADSHVSVRGGAVYRDSGRESARESGRDKVRESGRESARESARESGRDKVKESARESGRDSARESGREGGSVVVRESRSSSVASAHDHRDDQDGFSGHLTPLAAGEGGWQRGGESGRRGGGGSVGESGDESRGGGAVGDSQNRGERSPSRRVSVSEDTVKSRAESRAECRAESRSGSAASGYQSQPYLSQPASGSSGASASSTVSAGRSASSASLASAASIAINCDAYDAEKQSVRTLHLDRLTAVSGGSALGGRRESQGGGLSVGGNTVEGRVEGRAEGRGGDVGNSRAASARSSFMGSSQGGDRAEGYIQDSGVNMQNVRDSLRGSVAGDGEEEMTEDGDEGVGNLSSGSRREGGVERRRESGIDEGNQSGGGSRSPSRRGSSASSSRLLDVRDMRVTYESKLSALEGTIQGQERATAELERTVKEREGHLLEREQYVAVREARWREAEELIAGIERVREGRGGVLAELKGQWVMTRQGEERSLVDKIRDQEDILLELETRYACG